VSNLSRTITSDEELDAKIGRGIEAVYKVAKAAYGPGAGNALLELAYGDPIISRDGVTNVEKVILEDAVENMSARTVVQASKNVNRKVGDGTSAVIILSRFLYWEARKLIGAGYNRMMVAKMLEKTAREVIEQIDNVKISVDDCLLKHVAIVSSGDESIGHMIADVIGEVGLDGGVTVEDFAGSGIYSEVVDGFYFRKGFTNINLVNDPSNLESRHENVDILITDKSLKTAADIAPIIEKIIASGGKGSEVVIIGDVQEEALATLVLNRLKGVINSSVVDVPAYGAMRTLFLEDIAIITGGKVLTNGSNSSAFTVDMLGGADKLIIDENSTTIIGSQGDSKATVDRIDELRKQLAESESAGTREALQDRLSKLTGKIAIIKVGGATEVEQMEVKLRVQDAICAVQAALSDGIVPGGGTVLLRSNTENFSEAFKAPFKILVENSGYNTEQATWNVLQSKPGHGYDLRQEDFNYKTIDLIKAGIVDPASVMKEVVKNSASVISKLITASVAVTYKDREAKNG